MKLPGLARRSPSLSISLSAAVISLIVILLPWGSTLDRALLDALFQLRGRLAAPQEVLLVGIDEPSMHELKLPWPWPRDLHADLIESLFTHGAKVVAFDVLFDQASDNDQADQRFVEVIKQHPNLVLATARAIIDQEGFTQQIWLDPLPEQLDEKTATGFLEIPVDPDGVVRRALTRLEDKHSLSYVAVEKYAGDYHWQTTGIPGSTIRINFLGPPYTVKLVSYYQALNPKAFLPADTFKDKLIFVGRTTPVTNDIGSQTMRDHFPVPFAKLGTNTMSGVEIHAQIAHNLLYGNYINKLSTPLARIIGFLLAIGVGLLFFRLKWLFSVIAILAISALGAAITYFLFSQQAYYLPFTDLLIPLVAVFLGSSVYRFLHYRAQLAPVSSDTETIYLNNEQRLQQRLDELQKRWQQLSELVDRLNEDKILETRTEEKLRLEKRINEASRERQEVEQQLVEVESELNKNKKDEI